MDPDGFLRAGLDLHADGPRSSGGLRRLFGVRAVMVSSVVMGGI
jgi:hypothetical protein